MEKCTAIVLAAGQGKRMHSKIQKQFLNLEGCPVLYYSLRCFQESLLIQEIVLVTSADAVEYCLAEIVEKYAFTKVTKIVPGGKERYDSVYAGLLACDAPDYVFIHDGARPFITGEILERGLEAVRETGAAVVGMPSKDTVKISTPDGLIDHTPDRRYVWQIQTPQIFSYDLILRAHESIRKKNMSAVTDDAMIAEQETDAKIRLVEGSYQNIKITTPEDLAVGRAFLRMGENE